MRPHRGTHGVPKIEDNCEIIGFAGITGSGRTEAARVIFGADRATSGEMTLHGKPYRPRSPRDAINHGIALVTEDRKRQGLLLKL